MLTPGTDLPRDRCTREDLRRQPSGSVKRRVIAHNYVGSNPASELSERGRMDGQYLMDFHYACGRKFVGVNSRGLLGSLDVDRIQRRHLRQPSHQSRAQLDGMRLDRPVAHLLNRDALSLLCSLGPDSRDQQRVLRVLSGTCAP